MLNSAFQIETGGRGVTVKYRDYSPEELKGAAQNMVFSAVGISAMAIDQALDDVFGSKNPTDTDQIGSLRAIVYMLRCSFAHDIAAPVWLCDPKYRRKYSIFLPESGLINFDGAHLNGQPVSLSHVGGLEGYVEIIRLCEKQVDR